MAKNQGVKMIVAVVLFAAAGLILYKFWPRTVTEGAAKSFWVCLSPKCGHEFEITAQDKKSMANQDVPCPKCGGTDTNDAYKCPHCLQLYLPEGHGAIPDNCPKCKKSLKVVPPAG